MILIQRNNDDIDTLITLCKRSYYIHKFLSWKNKHFVYKNRSVLLFNIKFSKKKKTYENECELALDP